MVMVIQLLQYYVARRRIDPAGDGDFIALAWPHQKDGDYLSYPWMIGSGTSAGVSRLGCLNRLETLKRATQLAQQWRRAAVCPGRYTIH
jgi:hypothetical protein